MAESGVERETTGIGEGGQHKTVQWKTLKSSRVTLERLLIMKVWGPNWSYSITRQGFQKWH